MVDKSELCTAVADLAIGQIDELNLEAMWPSVNNIQKNLPSIVGAADSTNSAITKQIYRKGLNGHSLLGQPRIFFHKPYFSVLHSYGTKYQKLDTYYTLYFAITLWLVCPDLIPI